MNKGNIFDIKHFAVHDGKGIRTTVFFKGCPLHCVWCHNPESQAASEQFGFLQHKCVNCGACVMVCPTGAQKLDENHKHIFDRSLCNMCGLCVSVCHRKALTKYGKKVTVEEILPELLQDIDFYEESNGGVTLSGGEPLLQIDFCEELLRQLKDANVNTAVDTCGFAPWESINRILPFTDTFLYDIKHMDPKKHCDYTGQRNELIIDNLRKLNKCGAKIEIRMPFIPSYNDDEANLRAMGELLGGMKMVERVKVLPYHEFARTKYVSIGMNDTMPQVKIPTEDDLTRAVNILKEYNVNAVSGTKA